MYGGTHGEHRQSGGDRFGMVLLWMLQIERLADHTVNAKMSLLINA
jgi:hypothetical protein